VTNVTESMCFLRAQGASTQPRLEDIPRSTILFVSFANGHYSDFMINWSKHLKRLQVQFLVCLNTAP